MLDLLVDGLRHMDGREQARRQLTQVSNPCWYRYDVPAFQQQTPTTAKTVVRVYTHVWGGDVMGAVPRSWEQAVGLVDTARGWRVDTLEAPRDEREEPNEPHGPTTSACTVGHVPTRVPTGIVTPVGQ